MAEARVKKSHTLGLAGVRERAKTAEKDLAERYSAQTSWKDENTLNFARAGYKGYISLRELEVEFYVDLGFIGGLLKGKVETKATEILDRYFS